MASLLKQVFILGFLIFLELPSNVSGEVTDYGQLSLSIFEIKTDMEHIKRRMENLEKKVEGTCISTTVSPQFEGRAIKEEEIMDIKDDMNKQALAIKKTLTAEKLLLRETVKTFGSKFADFESKIQKDIALINASLEDKSEMMLDRINSRASALANSMAELESDFNFTNNDIRQTLETMETSMKSKFGDIETLMIANITMIQKQNKNECASGPCRNGGSCADNLNRYKCTCQKGYTGINCETARNCKYGWVGFDQSCYLFVDSQSQRRSWTDAQDDCRSRSSHLVVIESVEENNFVKQELSKRHPAAEDQYWTAGNDIQAEGKWMWGNQGVLINVSFWHPGEPNQKNGNEDCLTFYTRYNFDWNDEDCERKMPYICENECC